VWAGRRRPDAADVRRQRRIRRAAAPRRGGRRWGVGRGARTHRHRRRRTSAWASTRGAAATPYSR